MVIYGRLTLLDANLEMLAADSVELAQRNAAATSANLETHFRGIALISPERGPHVLVGQAPPPLKFSAEEQSFLESGRTLVTARKCESSSPCVYLARKLQGPAAHNELILAEAQSGFLWSKDELPGALDLSVFDAGNQVLYSSRNAAPENPEKVGRSSGEFEWKQGGQENVGHYWKLPLKAKFLADHWTVVASEEKRAALATLGSFRQNFGLVLLLALWIVLLFSLAQIRRTLVPLERLQEGTRKIASGDFRSRVKVTSRDEFAELAASFNQMAGRIETQVRSLKTLNEIDRAILSSWDLNQIVEAMIEQLPYLVPYGAVGITVIDFDKKKNTISYIAELGGQVEVENSEFLEGELSALAESPESFVLLNGRDALPAYLGPLTAKGMKQFLIVPVLVEGKAVAVLAFARSTEEEWSQDERQQARRVADQAAVAFSNAGLVSQLKQLRWGTLTALARAIDAKSSWTAGHSERVTSMAIKIGREMGLVGKDIDTLHAGGLLHDVGKIGVPVELLDKPGPLTPEERLQVQDHVLIGVRILKPVPGFEECMPIVQEHHERFDGRGYPYGLEGENIALHARIFAVADVHDALISDRPYRKGLPLDRVMQMIREGAGTQFDPKVVDAFLRLTARAEAEVQVDVQANEMVLQEEVT
jgi:putative nucleotidyltransferase with HDIG domain